tara:strand:- start:519 stop:2288 length:1770 start_codon:yes stop_codon:yes gene_type:complete
MATIEQSLDYLLEVDQQQQRLNTLIRQGMLPARQLPILHRALANMKAGKLLPPYEREAISKLLDKMMSFQFGDDVTYNRARLHTQKTKYQTEEKKVAKDKEGDVVVYDGSEDEAEAKKKNGKNKILKSNKGDGMKPEEDIKEAIASRPADEGQPDGDLNMKPKQGGSEDPEVGEACGKQTSRPEDGAEEVHKKPNIREGLIADLDAEGLRSRDSRRFKKAGRRAKDDILKGMPSSLRKEKLRTNERKLPDDLQKFNELYKKNLETALANRGVDNVRDVPENMKEKMFQKVEEASYSNKQIKMAKGIAFDKRYKGGNMTGAAKQMEKIKKGLSDHPDVSDALRKANEEVVQVDEISKDLAGRYKTAAQKDRKNTEARLKRSEDNLADVGSKNPRSMAGDDQYHKDDARSNKRAAGIAKANKRIKESKMATKDHDGDGKIESGKDEYFGSRDKAIKKAIAKKGKKLQDAVIDVMLGREELPEGAREDAMRDIKRDSGKGMAPVKKDPKPGKSKHDGSENKGPAHIVSQLRSVLDQGDKHAGVKFQDGKTHKVSVGSAHKFLNKYMSGKPQDKMKMQSHGHASHDNFKKHLD